ncbi:hypothetical protein N431DRAFT_107740 [Stipitochalara longipes BDJ]|nr:hypothetical protein N431DRAFT_107740 [Stipitochalara longipes BDJ]
MASSVEPTQATENLTAEVKTAVVVPSSAPIENGNVEELKTSTPDVPAQESEEAVWSTIASASQATQAAEKEVPDSTKEVVDASTTGAAEVKKVETKEAVPSAQDAPGTATSTGARLTKIEEVKVEKASVSKVVAGVVSGVAADINNVQVGLAQEVPPEAGKDASKPSVSTTIEGALRVVEKEAAKGAKETVATVEAHPELIAEGALAAVVGAASMIQPELLPGAVAIVGKMASDSAKATVIKIATDEGKKVGAAIGKDISDDAAKQKAVKAEKEATDAVKEKAPTLEGPSDSEANPLEASKDAPKLAKTPNGLANGHESTEKPIEGNVAKPDASAAASSADKHKSVEHEPIATEQASVEISTPVAAVAAAALITKTTTTTKSTSQEHVAASENAMASITQESLDQLHRKIDSLHEAIQRITETLALHLPPPTPVIEPLQQKTLESPKVDTAEVSTEAAEPISSPPTRPTLEKRRSVLGSISKILWPFGSASPNTTANEGAEVTTADVNAPKIPTVMVTEVPLTPEIEI